MPMMFRARVRWDSAARVWKVTYRGKLFAVTPELPLAVEFGNRLAVVMLGVG